MNTLVEDIAGLALSLSGVYAFRLEFCAAKIQVKIGLDEAEEESASQSG